MSEETKEPCKVDALKPSLRNVNLIAKLVKVETPRTVVSRIDRTEHRVTEALVGDETGSVYLTLWDDQIEAYNPDDVLDIKNGYTTLFRGSLRLNIGKYGTVEKVDKEIGEVNTGNNLSEKKYEETSWHRPAGRSFGRRPRY